MAYVVLALLLIYSFYIIYSTSVVALKVCMVTRLFKVEVRGAKILVKGNSTFLQINYKFYNPLDVELRVKSIQSTIYSGGTYVWTSTETYLEPLVVVSGSTFKTVVFEVPRSRLMLLSGDVSISTFILIEVMQPKTYSILLAFYFTNVSIIRYSY
ncbi:MAG: hypothetical protein DRJ26_03570 [Candidatus Methanomethylicota archaeon]|uniref:Late embryogenesis abundant protein LEA-2 subgroup domain-containing protein n=1 Tax=Thermoproteota archaeon TaxID=2056631 RepID=A0A497F1F3_9CREN|nr:MAG: hypothetical protein DRJ26_03570 [Candidatus Verstraetearchaeota archaeon]